MIKFSIPKEKTEERGIVYLVRTPEQVEEDLQLLMLTRYPHNKDDEDLKDYWRKLLSAKVPVCPKCGDHGGPVRRTTEDDILGCDHCLIISGYTSDDEE